jgi:hypothetical protein
VLVVVLFGLLFVVLLLFVRGKLVLPVADREDAGPDDATTFRFLLTAGSLLAALLPLLLPTLLVLPVLLPPPTGFVLLSLSGESSLSVSAGLTLVTLAGGEPGK